MRSGALALALAVLLLFPSVSAAKLVVYISWSEESSAPIIEAFEKKTGIDVEIVARSSGQTLSVVEAEKDAPVASVVYTGSLPSFIQGKEKGLFEPYFSPTAEELDEKFKDPEGYWAGVYIGAIGFATNPRSGLEPPQSWADLLKPEYKGKIVMSNPASSGTAFTVLATLVQLMGQDEALEYMKSLDGQVQRYTRSGSAPAEMVAKGEADIGVSFAHDILAFQLLGIPVQLSFPSEGTGWEIGGVALVKGAPSPDEAKKFIDFVLGPEAQKLYGVGQVKPCFPTHTDAPPPKGAVDLEELNIIDFDFIWAGKHRDELTKLWSDEIFYKR